MKYRLGVTIYKISKYAYLLPRSYCSRVPVTPISTLERTQQEKIKLDSSTISLLERLSLVKCDSAEGVQILEDSIEFANKILHINTDNVQPLYSVLENENLYLREDKVTQGNCQKDILKNSSLIEDDYFVAPPGNIPLHEVENDQIDSAQMKKNENLEKPSLIVLQNVHNNWLQSIYAKTKQHYPVYLSKDISQLKCMDKLGCHGYVDQCLPEQVKEIKVDFSNHTCNVTPNSELKFNAIIPQHDFTQGFIQWQRYRKYWWSSITTTPGLFSVTDMKYEHKSANANISANFKWGQWNVESINISPHNYDADKFSKLSCTLSLEKSLLTLLLDGTTNTKEEYLRLHNKMAPYKISFALNYKDECNFLTLQELATQIFYKLQSSKISTWLPDFSVSLDKQIIENIKMGVTYTAILSENTLSDGIFHLMNSSTMLKEQVHLADFVNYATLLCGKRKLN